MPLRTLLVAVAALTFSHPLFVTEARAETPTGALASQRHGVPERTVIDVVKRVSPAVVSVFTQGGGGTGFLIREDGLILTNSHVVGEAAQVTVRLGNGERRRGEVLGRDARADIAVLKIEGTQLPVAELGDSDALEVGQAVIAIGNPLGLERTVTMGVLSAINRRLDADRPEGLIQTDAAINPGNSGGPLLDSQGRVIGINTLILRRNGATGLGFAVPINVARDIAERVLTEGRVRRARLGISYNDVDPEMARAFRMPVSAGVVVENVLAGSPAARGGLRPGDIITRVGPRAIRGGGDLRVALRALRPGDVVEVAYTRGERHLVVEVALAGVDNV